MVSDDVAWLFVSAGDSHPQSTIARLADQLRTETGRIPSELHIYRFRAMSSDGVIRVGATSQSPWRSVAVPQFGCRHWYGTRPSFCGGCPRSMT